MRTHPIFESDFDCLTGWAWRWFVLSDNVLTYYTTKDKRAKGDKRGSIPVRGAFLSIEEDTNFSLTVDDHTYHFQAPDSSERKRWIDALECCIENNQQHNQSLKIRETFYGKSRRHNNTCSFA